MRVLGIETSCDETGVALYDTERGLVADALHSQVAMHQAFGGVVPELASRDHVQRVLPLIQQVLAEAGIGVRDVDAIAYTQGPGLAGALLVGASIASALGFALGKPVIGVHHMEGHLLSPMLGTPAPEFPFVALLVSGGHTQFFEVVRRRALSSPRRDARRRRRRSVRQDGAPARVCRILADRRSLRSPRRAARTRSRCRGRCSTPATSTSRFPDSRPRSRCARAAAGGGGDPAALPDSRKADIAHAFQAAVVDVLVAKSLQALDQTGFSTLVVAGGVGANRALRARLAEALDARGGRVYFPEPKYCTDNGAMIAMVGRAAARRRVGRSCVFRAAALAAAIVAAQLHWPIGRSRPDSN